MPDGLEITIKVNGAVRASDVLQRALLPGQPPGPDTLLPLDTLIQLYARHVVERCGGNKSHAAKLLGVSRRKLYHLLDREAA